MFICIHNVPTVESKGRNMILKDIEKPSVIDITCTPIDRESILLRYNSEGASRGQAGRFGQKPFQPPADMRQVCTSHSARTIPPTHLLFCYLYFSLLEHLFIVKYIDLRKKNVKKNIFF